MDGHDHERNNAGGADNVEETMQGKMSEERHTFQAMGRHWDGAPYHMNRLAYWQYVIHALLKLLRASRI